MAVKDFTERKRLENLKLDTTEKVDYKPLNLQLKPGEVYRSTTQDIADVLFASGAISREQWNRVVLGRDFEEEEEDNDFSDSDDEFEQSSYAEYETEVSTLEPRLEVPNVETNEVDIAPAPNTPEASPQESAQGASEQGSEK